MTTAPKQSGKAPESGKDNTPAEAENNTPGTETAESTTEKRKRYREMLAQLDRENPEADTEEPDKRLFFADGSFADIAGGIPTHHTDEHGVSRRVVDVAALEK